LFSSPLLFCIQILAAHCSTEQTVRARLDGFKSRLQAKDDKIGCKNLEMEALANALKKAKAENKRLQSELEKGKEARAEVDRLKAELEKEKAHSAVLTDYYNLTELKMEALRQEVLKAEASTAEESRHFLREMVRTTESARTACQTLRLALTDMGAKVRGVPPKVPQPSTSPNGPNKLVVRFRTAPLRTATAVRVCQRLLPRASYNSSAVSTSPCSPTTRRGIGKSVHKTFRPRFLRGENNSGKGTAAPSLRRAFWSS
jgi:hypothetical protein